MSVGCFTWFQCPALFRRGSLRWARLILDLLQAVPDDLDQVAEAGNGEVRQHAALERGPDALSRFAIVNAALDRRV